MRRQLLELGLPRGIDRPVLFVRTADPVEKLGLSFVIGRFDRVMNTAEADSTLDQLSDEFHVITDQCGMLFLAVAINDNRIGVFQRCIVIDCLAVDLLGWASRFRKPLS